MSTKPAPLLLHTHDDAVYIHASPTSGKTWLARRIGALDTDDVWKALTPKSWSQLTHREQEQLTQASFRAARAAIARGQHVVSNFYIPNLPCALSAFRVSYADAAALMRQRDNEVWATESEWRSWVKDWQLFPAGIRVSLQPGEFLAHYIRLASPHPPFGAPRPSPFRRTTK